MKGEGNGDYSFDGCDTITFKNMTLKVDNKNYRGFIRISNTVVDNCTMEGRTAYWGYETAKFQNGTVFNAPENSYALWDYSSKSMTFDNCTFNISGLGVNVYVETGNAGSAARKVEMKDCTVKSEGGTEQKAFLNIKNNTQAYEITFSGTNTVNGLEADTTTGSNLYQVKTTEITETSGKTVEVKQEQEDGTYKTIYEVKANETGTDAGTEDNPYTLAQLSKMTRDEYITAQERLKGKMYVTVGDYRYDKNGVLGNGVRNDKLHQTEDRSVLNGYNSNGYLSYEGEEGKKNDGANGKEIIFVDGTITSGVTGYTSIDSIGTSLLLAVPAYTKVTFQGTTFNGVLSFDYQLYTGPWSQLGEINFESCTFNGIIVGAIASQSLSFNKCTFNDYTNSISANSSNPTWIRPAYGNWSKGDNEGQGENFKSLTTIKFTGNTVNSTRPVKFERIAQWEMPTTVTATGNKFTISAQEKDKTDGETKNVGMYFGANAKFNLVADHNVKLGETAALYTAVYDTGNGTVPGLPAGSTVQDSKGEDTVLTDAYEWKTKTPLELKTTSETTETVVATIGSNEYTSLDEAIKEVKDGETIVVNAGEYKLNSSLTYTGKTFTIKAAANAKVSFDMTKAVALHGAKITFEDVTFDYKSNANYTGLQHADTLVYNNCVINGMVFLYAASETFNNCEFNQTVASAYNVWTYGAKKVEFNNCKFNCVGRCVLVYNEGATAKTDLTVKDTTFNASAPVDGKAAIEIDTSLMKQGGATITIEGEKTTATGFSTNTDSGDGLWNDKGNETVETNTNITVTVAGEKVYAPKVYVAQVGENKYETLKEAIEQAGENGIVTLIANATEDVTINKNITLDLGGKTLTNTNAGKATISVTGGTVTVKNGFVMGGTDYYNIEVTKGSNANLTLEDVTATAGNNGSSMIDNWGTMTIKSGTYTGGLNVVKSEEGSTLVINGGTFTLDYATSGYTGVILVYGDTTITGGEFIQSLTTTGRWNHPQVIVTGVVEGYTAITRVTGGTFTNKMSGEGIFRGIGDGTSDNFEVTGGTFNKSVSDSYFKAGYFAKLTDGVYTADGPFVAKVGNSAGYDTLPNAIAAAKSGETVTLLVDTEISAPLTVDTAITLDLGGKTLTSTWVMPSNAAGAARYALVNNAKMKLTNGTFKVGQARGVGAYAALEITSLTMTQELTGGHACVAFCAAGKSYSIKSCTLDGAYAVCNFANNATINIEKSTLIGKGNALYHNGSQYGLKLTVKKTTITGGAENGCGVYISGSTDAQKAEDNKNGAGGYQQATFTDCTISGANGVEVKYTDLTLDNCVVSSTRKSASYKQDNNGPTGLGFAVISSDNAVNLETPKPEGTITIKGTNGKYTGNVGLGSLASVKTKYEGFTDTTIAVSGGTFNKAVLADYCAEGFVPVKNANGTYGVEQGTAADYAAIADGVYYKTFEEALSAVKSLDGSIKLLKDVDGNFTISKRITLDLNGCTINGGTTAGEPTLKIDNNRVVIMDSSEAKMGTVKREDTAENSGNGSHYVIDIQGKNGFLRVLGGNFENNSGTEDGKGASLIRLGDGSVAVSPALTIEGGTFHQDNFIVIQVDRGTLHFKGGEINCANSYAIENRNNAYVEGGTVNGTVSTWVYSTGVAFSKLEIKDGTVNGDVASVNYDKAEGKQARVLISGGYVKGTLGTYTYSNGLVPTQEKTMATIEASGGTFDKPVLPRYCADGCTSVKNSNGTYGVAQSAVAMIGDELYYSMDDALKAQSANGGTLVLLRDYTTSKVFNSGSTNKTVDLNGYTWTYTISDNNAAALEIGYSDVTVTFENGNIVSNTLIGLIPAPKTYTGLITYNNAGFVFDNVKMTANGHCGIETNGNNTNDTVTLVNSELNVPEGYGIYFASSGKLTIDNSIINAKTMGVQVCAGSLEITGKDTAITVTGDPVTKTENDGAIEDGAAISIVNRDYKPFGTIAVENGTFTAKEGNKALKAYNWDNANKTESAFDNTTKRIVTVSGGTYSSTFDASLCNEGYAPKKNADGLYVVDVIADVAQVGDKTYTSLETAYAEAKDGDTIKLLADCSSDRINLEDKSITVALNGHTLTSTAAYGVMFCAKNGKTITIDGTVEGSKLVGTVMVTEKTEGHIVLNGGTYESDKYCPLYINGAVSTENSTLTVTNATITALEGNSDQDNGVAVYLAGYSTSTFTNTTITAPSTGLEIRAGKLTLNNCNVTGGHGVVETSANGNGTTVTNAAIAVSQHTTRKAIDVTINGGTYNATAAFYQTDVQSTGSADVKTSITNGTFIGTLNADTTGALAISGGKFTVPVEQKYCATGFAPTKNSDGTYGVTPGSYVAAIGDNKYTTLEAALKAAKAGQTVQLIANAECEEVEIRNKVTLDLAGKTLNADYVSYFGGDMIDSSSDNSGLLKPLNENDIMFNQNTKATNKITQIPVFDKTKGGYVLTGILLKSNPVGGSLKQAGTLQAYYYPKQSDTVVGWTDAQKTLFGEENGNPVTATFRLTYLYKGSDEEQVIEFNFVNRFMNSTLKGKWMYVTIKNHELDNFDYVTLMPILKSAGGQVELHGTTVETQNILDYFITKAES